MRVSIYSKDNLESTQTRNELERVLKANNHVLDDKNPEIIFVIGGDGTFLKAINDRINQLDSIKFVGVKTGHLGYFYDFEKEDFEYVAKNIEELSKNYQVHHLIKAHLNKDNVDTLLYAVNEIRIENPFHTLKADVYINDEYFENFNGNGLMVSSTIGSSAYNKSLGGAVIDNTLDLLELTEIAPILNSQHKSLGSSYVLSKDTSITFKGDFNNVVVGYDNRTHPISEFQEITISVSNKKFSLIHPKDHSKIRVIKDSFIN